MIYVIFSSLLFGLLHSYFNENKVQEQTVLLQSDRLRGTYNIQGLQQSRNRNKLRKTTV